LKQLTLGELTRPSFDLTLDTGWFDSRSDFHFTSEKELQRAERAAELWLQVLEEQFLAPIKNREARIVPPAELPAGE
jgi:hypothetical protein